MNFSNYLSISEALNKTGFGIQGFPFKIGSLWFMYITCICTRGFTKQDIHAYTPCSGKVGWKNVWLIYSFQAFGPWFGRKRFGEWWMNSSAKSLLIVTTNLVLANRSPFTKFVKLSIRQTFLLYGILFFSH